MEEPVNSKVSEPLYRRRQKKMDFWIDHLGMQKHPEGGYYVRSYNGNKRFTTDVESFEQSKERVPTMTGIYFLLGKTDASTLHQLLDADEMWHFNDGDPIYIVEVEWEEDDKPRVSLTKLGNPFKHPGAVLQHVVPSGKWFGAVPCEGTDYALVGCAVSPGFTFSRFKLCDTDVATRLKCKLGDAVPPQLLAILPRAQNA